MSKGAYTMISWSKTLCSVYIWFALVSHYKGENYGWGAYWAKNILLVIVIVSFTASKDSEGKKVHIETTKNHLHMENMEPELYKWFKNYRNNSLNTFCASHPVFMFYHQPKYPEHSEIPATQNTQYSIFCFTSCTRLDLGVKSLSHHLIQRL